MKNITFFALLFGVALFAWWFTHRSKQGASTPVSTPPAPSTKGDVPAYNLSTDNIQCIAAPCNIGGINPAGTVATPQVQIVLQPPKQLTAATGIKTV